MQQQQLQQHAAATLTPLQTWTMLQLLLPLQLFTAQTVVPVLQQGTSRPHQKGPGMLEEWGNGRWWWQQSGPR